MATKSLSMSDATLSVAAFAAGKRFNTPSNEDKLKRDVRAVLAAEGPPHVVAVVDVDPDRQGQNPEGK